jgi:hypothetical protein
MPVFRSVQDAQQGEIKLEALHQPLYDSADITAAGDISFFQNPSGRSELLTNVKTAGQLSWPKRFSVKAIRLVPEPGTVLTDLLALYQNSIFRLGVGEKNYLTVPAFMLTPGLGLELQGAAGAITYANNGRPDHRNIYSLIHSVYLPPVQNFAASLQILAAASFSTAGFALWCFLEGELLREIQ